MRYLNLIPIQTPHSPQSPLILDHLQSHSIPLKSLFFRLIPISRYIAVEDNIHPGVLDPLDGGACGLVEEGEGGYEGGGAFD